jgi:hypothetical protein
VAKHGRVKWVTRVGRIWPAGAYGGRSTAQWRVPTAAKPPVRFPATIGEARWCPVLVSVWWSFDHSLIEQRKAREGEGSSPEQGREHGGACLNGSGRRAVRMAGVVWRRRGSGGGPFIGARGREGDGGDGEHRRALHGGENGANSDWDGSGRPRGVRGRLKHSGGVVAEAGEH